MTLRFVSVEPSRRCTKACSFCYNGSDAHGDGRWTASELVAFARDLAANGVEVLSFGGGEPLEWVGVFDTLRELDGVLLRTLTTNGLPLRDASIEARLVAAKPDKVHVSIHRPGNAREVRRVIDSVHRLAERGLRSGINLMVPRSRLAEASSAAAAIRSAGIQNERIVYLPMRGSDTPTPEEILTVAGGPFQSMTCLRGCGRSERFASVAADRTAAWCSYTTSRRALRAPTFEALRSALHGLGVRFCGEGQLVRLSRSPAG